MPTYTTVSLPSGAPFDVLTDEEAAYLENLCREYGTTFQFTSVSDVADLDRLVSMELISHRLNQWSIRRRDYDDKAIDEKATLEAGKGLSLEIRQLKKLLGVDRMTREKQKGDGSLAHYIQNLLRRAKEFDVHRDDQRDLALEMSMQLIGMVGAYRGMTVEERRELHYTAEDLLDWVQDYFAPAMEELDAAFRQHQKTWIRDL